MKRSLYILTLGLLLGMFLTACQTEALPGEQTGGGSKTVGMPDTCYINLHIVNNSQPATRAVVDATSAENAIYDGILCILEGDTEGNAALKSAVVIDQLLNNSTDGYGVGNNGTSVNVIQQLPIQTYAYTKNLYALVLLNTTESGFTVSNGMLYHNGTTQSGKTLSQIQNLKINGIGSTEKYVGLFMANKNGQLPQVTSTYLFDTESAAQSGSRLTIEVERAAAKVKVTNDIGSKSLSGINLNGSFTSHPKIHKMTWTLNKYNASAFAVGGGDGDTGAFDYDLTFSSDNDFSVFHQRSYNSGDEIYIGENNSSTQTEVVVEVQLKDASNVLLGDCFQYTTAGHNLFVGQSQYVQYLKTVLTDGLKSTYNLTARTADEIFLNAKVVIQTDGSVTITLTNTAFNATEQTGLAGLAAYLSGRTTYFRDGKMYYTYQIGSNVVRNNSYDLKLEESSSSGPQPATATFIFNLGTDGQTATFSEGWFKASDVTYGSNFTISGSEKGQTIFESSSKETSAAETNAIYFSITPDDGLTFTPTNVSFKGTRYGTDGGQIVVNWINSDGTSVSLTDGSFYLNRNNATPSVTEWSKEVTGAAANNGPCGLKLNIYTLDPTKQVGFSDIIIEGIINGAPLSEGSIKGIGRNAP